MTTPSVPVLEKICGSWVVVDRATGRPLFETVRQATAEAASRVGYEVLTALQWLDRFNRSIKDAP